MLTIIYVIILINTSLLTLSISQDIFRKSDETKYNNNVQTPIVDKLGEPLMANLDISKLNQQLMASIDKEIQQGVQNIFNNRYVAKIEKLENDLNYLNGLSNIVYMYINIYVSRIHS